MKYQVALICLIVGCIDGSDGNGVDGGALVDAAAVLPDASAALPDAAVDAGTSPDVVVVDAGVILPDAGADVSVPEGCACSSGEVCALDHCIVDISNAAPQRANLADTPAGPRFPLPTDRRWPSRTDAPVITLWHDDAFAAVSLSIDDNPAADYDWWASIANEYAFHLTWCAVTDVVDGGNAFFGTWSMYQNLVDAGHNIGSNGFVLEQPPTGAARMPWFVDAIVRSQGELDANLVGNDAEIFGYPWGEGVDEPQIRALVAANYIAARSGRGFANRANRIDYFDIHSTSIGFPASSVDRILPGGPEARGWHLAHYHFLGNGTQGDAEKQIVRRELDYVRSHGSDVWLGTLRDVARYGQERDTARLVVHEASDARVVFSISDEMDDAVFDFPLTTKVRLPDGWSQVRAFQKTTAVAVRIVTQGARYALVEVVPDEGPVTLLP